MNIIKTIFEDLRPLIPHRRGLAFMGVSFFHQFLFRSGVHALLVFRIQQLCHKYYFWPAAYVCRKILYHWYHVDIWGQTQVGPGHWWPHPLGIVYSRHAKIGRRVQVYHNVSVISGSNGAPDVGDFAVLYAGCLVIGGVRVGRGATIGAGAVVTNDVPAYAVVTGNPAQVLRYRRSDEIDVEDAGWSIAGSNEQGGLDRRS